MAPPRRIAVVTGTRAEYGLLESSMRGIDAHPELELLTVVTGMHLSPRHGMTVDEVEADGFTVDERVHMQVDGDSGLTMAKSLGLGLSGLAESFGRLDPDVVLVLGDRDEAFAAGVAAAHMNIPIAHVHGGDSMDGAIIDDSIRHALTKFAHLHFPVSEQSAARIEQLGEEPWRVTTVGAPGLDDILAGEYTSPEAVRERYGLDTARPLALVVQHPVTTEAEAAGDQMRATLDALETFDELQVVLVYPNSDAGGQRAIEAIESHPLGARAMTTRSLPRRDFLGVMAAADVMVGNSSSGIIEAPSFGLPVVDVGPRQSGRQRAENVVSVSHEADAVREAVERCLTDDALRQRAATCESPYDYGGAGERIVDRLATVDLDERLVRKRLTF
ncbi:UDP-N-acetylglucosamine 2-epimerase [Salinigranum halophilum]|uniref:UDP-N-acetylglucosamine 2-epimerase n=1 Tax=Salinigranum halophilum TaxID=2565931 RepID=UPI00115CAF0B|nr:UDP-N-acetylglucosamine 2-epimerase [Salinigranum halophilum]